jgi:serine/threonine protein kinase
MPLSVGDKLGHYEIRALIGAGGMGEIYRAYDRHLERDVALKILPAGLLSNEGARKRFRHEALVGCP